MSTKKIKVLLVYPDYFSEKDTAKNNEGGNYSEGLASISAVLKQGGYDVSLLHIFYNMTEEEFKNRIKKEKADIIGFSMRTTVFEYVKKLVKWTKEVDTKALLLCGGYHPTLIPDDVIAIDGMDAIIVGEGEYPLLELCNALRDKKPYTKIESFYFKDKKGKIIKNKVRPLIEDLDQLPFPDINLFDYKNLAATKVNYTLIMLSRGCLFSCTYCGNSQFRNVYPNKKHYARFRSPEKAIELIQNVIKNHPNIKYISFRDAIFNMYEDWFDEFIVLYKEKINKPFTCNLRFDVLKEEDVKRLAEAGCYMIDVGVESGDKEIRTKYLKRFMTDEQMIQACKWLHKYKIKTLTYNIIGLPFETLERALKTVKLNAKLESDQIIPNIFYPYPMTVLEETARKAGFVPDVIPEDCKVPLVQENFTEKEVLFVKHYFMSYVNAYKRAEKMKEPFKTKYINFLDWSFTNKKIPRGMLVSISKVKNDVYNKTKKAIHKIAPQVYLKLRDIRNKKR